MHLYVHVPFCSRRCSYCDFAIAVRRDVPVDDFIRGITAELNVRQLGGGDTLDTLYFGGGTPSKLGPDGVRTLIDVVRARFRIADDAEVTLETNPEDVNADAVRAWRAAGINRLSLGAQSFDDRVLAWMHRTHGASDTARAVRIAREEGIDNLSLDLIFALPASLDRDWDRDLSQAIALAPDHISAYGLTIESGTPLGRWRARGDVDELPEERWADEFTRAHDALTAAGLEHYEVSNYGRTGKHAVHNDAYWLHRPYLGVGPSAHGFDGDVRRWNESAYARWHAQVMEGTDPVAGSEALTEEQRAAERVYLGLRTHRGLELDLVDSAMADRWLSAGWARVEQRHGSRYLTLSLAGWMRLDALVTALTSFGSR